MTRHRGRAGRRPAPRGLAAVELALLLPMLLFVAFITADYARCLASLVVVYDGAYAGALYASDPTNYQASTGFSSAPAAAVANAVDLNVGAANQATAFPPPTYGVDSNGKSYADVWVNYTFITLVNYPGIPSSVPLNRKVRMPVLPP